MPEAAALARIRDNIDERPQDIKSVLTNSQVQKEFFPGTDGNEAKTIKAFVKGSSENALKTKPKVGVVFLRMKLDEWTRAVNTKRERVSGFSVVIFGRY